VDLDHTTKTFLCLLPAKEILLALILSPPPALYIPSGPLKPVFLV